MKAMEFLVQNVKAAAMKIGYPFDDGVTEYVLITLEAVEDLEVTEQTELTPDVERKILATVDQWLQDTRINYYDECDDCNEDNVW